MPEGTLQALARKLLPAETRRMLARWRMALQGKTPPTYGYKVLDGGVPQALQAGWQDPAIPDRQDEIFAPLIQDVREGRPRQDFVNLAVAVEATGMVDPFIVEAGCGTGINLAALEHLLGRKVRYAGFDYARPMVVKGRRNFPRIPWGVGDHAAMPLKDASCDLLLSGGVLIHMPNYPLAIAETRRVTRRWCLFHIITVRQSGPTTTMKKYAYGKPVPELVFNEAELLARFQENGLVVRKVLENHPYDLEEYLGEHTANRSYLCEVEAPAG